MATVKKIKKFQPGGQCTWSGKRGGGVSCGPRRAGKSEGYKPGRVPRMSKKEERQIEAEMRGDALMKSGKRDRLITTSPGIRSGERQGEYKKGSQSFFGGEKDPNEARYGKKVVKKSSVKKAKTGAKIKSVKKSKKK